VDKITFHNLVWGWIILAGVMFMVLLFVKAPYGRHSSPKWGITIPNRLGWVLMEIPSPLVFLIFFLNGNLEKTTEAWFIALLFLIHYTNRALIFPFRIRTSGKRMPLLIALLAVGFNVINGSFLGYHLGNFHNGNETSLFSDIRFFAGALLFFTGLIINTSADESLIRLRKMSETGYQIPQGGLFRWISCPNFFGEILEWLGYALLCWSLPALAFFIWTFCNLVPRALDHHRWYKQKFPDYPPNRKAVFPGIL
jgi:protein-S-isoprenylcysteine O-methyltransferase Ste14